VSAQHAYTSIQYQFTHSSYMTVYRYSIPGNCYYKYFFLTYTPPSGNCFFKNFQKDYKRPDKVSQTMYFMNMGIIFKSNSKLLNYCTEVGLTRSAFPENRCIYVKLAKNYRYCIKWLIKELAVSHSPPSCSCKDPQPSPW
jgi:hypothetical protein